MGKRDHITYGRILQLGIDQFLAAFVQLCHVWDLIAVVIGIAQKNSMAAQCFDVGMWVTDFEAEISAIGRHGKGDSSFSAGHTIDFCDDRKHIVFTQHVHDRITACRCERLYIADHGDFFIFLIEQTDIVPWIIHGKQSSCFYIVPCLSVG